MVDKYRLTVDRYRGDAGDAITVQELSIHVSNGQMFSTPDSDNDANADNSCALNQRAGWWYGKCSRSELNVDDNGQWSNDTAQDVQASRMLVKLN